MNYDGCARKTQGEIQTTEFNAHCALSFFPGTRTARIASELSVLHCSTSGFLARVDSVR